MKLNLGLVLVCALLLQKAISPDCTGAMTDPAKGCSACTATNTEFCLVCKAGYKLVSGSSGCSICEKDTWAAADNPENFCIACTNGKITVGTGTTAESNCFTPVASCETYSAASVCSACTTGKTPINGGTECILKISGCATQQTASLCTACETGKILLNNGAQCIAPIQNCKVQISESLCSECITEHKLSSDQKSCSRSNSSSFVFKIFLASALVLILQTF